VAATMTGVSVLGRNVARHDPARRHLDDARRQHILLAPLDHGRGAHGAGVLNPVRQRDRQHQHDGREGLAQRRRQQFAEDRRDQDRHQQRRDRQHGVAEPHQQIVDAPAMEAGEQAERDADRHRDQDGCKPDRERDARAVEDGREDVATCGSVPRRKGHSPSLLQIGESPPCR